MTRRVLHFEFGVSNSSRISQKSWWFRMVAENFNPDSKFNNYRTRSRTFQETEHSHNSSDDNRRSLNLLVVFNSLYIFITRLELGKLMFSFNHSLLPSKFNKSIAMPLGTRTIFTFLFAEQTFVNFLSVSKDQLIIPP